MSAGPRWRRWRSIGSGALTALGALLAVDFYGTGDVIDVVDTLNGITEK